MVLIQNSTILANQALSLQSSQDPSQQKLSQPAFSGDFGKGPAAPKGSPTPLYSYYSSIIPRTTSAGLDQNVHPSTPLNSPSNVCLFNGETIANGGTSIGYRSASVSFGQPCLSQTLSCSDGVLSNASSYPYATCVVSASASCQWNGQNVPAGNSVIAYQAASVSAGSQCTSEVRTCLNGNLQGSYQYASCSVQQMQTGVTFWGGQIQGITPSAMIGEGEILAEKLGVHAIGIVLSSMSDQDYSNGSCILNPTLASLANRADFKALLADPQFSTVLIVASDGASQPDCNTKYYYSPSFFTSANTALVEHEYTDLANILKQYQNKTFIIQNWEADNDIYCGDSHNAKPGDCPHVSDKIAGYIDWMNAKIAGVTAAHASNVKVALEFNDVHTLANNGMSDALNAIVPYINADYYSYSAYESTNISSQQFSSDIDYIRSILTKYGKNPDALMIGEVGVSNTQYEIDGGASRLLSDLAVAQQKNIPYAFVWNLIDQPDYGAYDTNGMLTNYGRAINPTQYVSLTGLQGLDKTGNDAYTTGWGYDDQELVLYGSFSDNSNVVTINGISYVPIYQSPTQINVLLAPVKVQGSTAGTDVQVSVTNTVLGVSSVPMTFKLLTH